MDIDGMKKLAVEQSLGNCADCFLARGTVHALGGKMVTVVAWACREDKENGDKNAYLYIHKNLLWCLAVLASVSIIGLTPTV